MKKIILYTVLLATIFILNSCGGVVGNIEKYSFFSNSTLHENINPEVYSNSYIDLYNYINRPWIVYDNNELIVRFEIVEHSTNHS